MFGIDAKFTGFAVKHDQILSLAQTMNAITVQVPGFPVAPAMGYVVGFRLDATLASVVVCLHYAEAKRTVAYVPDPRGVAPAALAGLIDEGREFLESMGFMVEDTGLAGLGSEERAALLARIPLFGATAAAAVSQPAPAAKAPPAAPEAALPEARSQALGRLLASF